MHWSACRTDSLLWIILNWECDWLQRDAMFMSTHLLRLLGTYAEWNMNGTLLTWSIGEFLLKLLCVNKVQQHLGNLSSERRLITYLEWVWRCTARKQVCNFRVLCECLLSRDSVNSAVYPCKWTRRIQFLNDVGRTRTVQSLEFHYALVIQCIWLWWDLATNSVST